MEYMIEPWDREVVEREIAGFVPERIFDAHVHLYDRRHFAGEIPAACGNGFEPVGIDTYHRAMAALGLPPVSGGLFFAFPSARLDLAAANDFVLSQVSGGGMRALMATEPGMDPEFI